MDKKTFTKELARALGSNMYRLAKDTGIAYCQIQRYANGSNIPTLQTARKISIALNVPMDDLLYPGETKICEPTSTTV